MNIKGFTRSIGRLRFQLGKQAVLNSVLTVAVGFLAAKVYFQEPITRLIPPFLTQEAEVAQSSANEAFMTGWGFYVAILTGNITPKNAVLVADQLGWLVEPRIYSRVRQQIIALSQDPVFKERGGSASFQPSKVAFEAESGKVFTTGTLVPVTAAGRGDPVPYVIEVELKIRNGRPVVTGLDHYPGKVMRSLKWHAKHKKQSEALKKKAGEPPAEEPTSWFSDALRYGQHPNASESDVEYEGDELAASARDASQFTNGDGL